jgi:hypothetical protein
MISLSRLWIFYTPSATDEASLRRVFGGIRPQQVFQQGVARHVSGLMQTTHLRDVLCVYVSNQHKRERERESG